jgi:hypothetical protein
VVWSEQSELRSVDSERAGQVIEPRKAVIAEPTSSAARKATSGAPRKAAWCTRSAGVEEPSMFAKGLSKNLGDPVVSTSEIEGRGLRHRRSSEEEPETATPRCLARLGSPW